MQTGGGFVLHPASQEPIRVSICESDGREPSYSPSGSSTVPCFFLHDFGSTIFYSSGLAASLESVKRTRRVYSTISDCGRLCSHQIQSYRVHPLKEQNVIWINWYYHPYVPCNRPLEESQRRWRWCIRIKSFRVLPKVSYAVESIGLWTFNYTRD